MIGQAMTQSHEPAVEALFGDELTHADEALANVQPILRHLLGSDDHALFSDRIVAQIRAQLTDLACQLAGALDGAGVTAEALADAFVANPLLLGHAHALAIEAHLTERLAARLALDPVVSPRVQELVASPDADVSAAAMALLAAQARFGQTQRRGELPLTELPGDLLHIALLIVRAHCSNGAAAVEKFESTLRGQFDEASSRLGLLHRLVGGSSMAALDIGHAGVALFVTALARGAGLTRDAAVLATSQAQMSRLALALLAAGADPATVEQQFLALHPDVVLPHGFETLGATRAAALLAGAGGNFGP